MWGCLQAISYGATHGFCPGHVGRRPPKHDTQRRAAKTHRVLSSPADWRDEVIYFLLPDRFSDGKEGGRPLLDPANRGAFRPAGFRFDRWAQSGGDCYQGGTIKGIISKLDYIKKLGATTLWVGPVFKQRLHWDSYHGYAIQDFLEVDPRLGTRQDLVDLVTNSHAKGLRILLDIVFNHSGNNWVYAGHIDQDPGIWRGPSSTRRGRGEMDRAGWSSNRRRR